MALYGRRLDDGVTNRRGESSHRLAQARPRVRMLRVSVDLRDLLPAVIGSFVGVIGWPLVGVHMQRRQFGRQARNAASAVYFELEANLAAIRIARRHRLFADLGRSSFDRLLPDLVTLMPAVCVKVVVAAYTTHAGYRQVASSPDLPIDVQDAALAAFIGAHEAAVTALRESAFSAGEARALAVSVDP